MPPQPDPGVLVVDASALRAEVAVVGMLAQQQLSARRNGCRIVLRGASPELAGLIERCGLAEVLALERAVGDRPRTAGLGGGHELANCDVDVHRGTPCGGCFHSWSGRRR